MKGGEEWFLIPSSNKRSATDGCRVTYPSEPTVKPTGFSTMANTPSFSPVKDNIDGIVIFSASQRIKRPINTSTLLIIIYYLPDDELNLKTESVLWLHIRSEPSCKKATSSGL